MSGIKIRNIWKLKIYELQTNSNIKNIKDLYSGFSNFKKVYQPGTNIVKDEKGHLITHYHSILARWKNHFSQLLNVHGINDARQTERHTAEQLVPALELEMATEELK
jgi:predicted PolB exonuclease-like 3'-5' exonuclease